MPLGIGIKRRKREAQVAQAVASASVAGDAVETELAEIALHPQPLNADYGGRKWFIARRRRTRARLEKRNAQYMAELTAEAATYGCEDA